MRDFDYIASPAKLLTPEIVQMVGSIHEHKGKQELFLEANVDELNGVYFKYIQFDKTTCGLQLREKHRILMIGHNNEREYENGEISATSAVTKRL